MSLREKIIEAVLAELRTPTPYVPKSINDTPPYEHLAESIAARVIGEPLPAPTGPGLWAWKKVRSTRAVWVWGDMAAASLHVGWGDPERHGLYPARRRPGAVRGAVPSGDVAEQPSGNNMRKRDEIADPNSCFNRATDNEWLFVLLARDQAAAATVRFWIGERIRLGMNAAEDEKIMEAGRWAETMEQLHHGPM